MDASVVIPTYNHVWLLAETLERLRQQVLPPSLRWEVVIVDNNCTDNTPDLVRRLAGGFPVPLRIVREPEQGVSCARNRGIAEARGHYIAFTDDDTFPDATWLATIMDTFRARRCDGVFGRISLAWLAPRPRWLADDVLGFLGHLDYGSGERRITEPGEPPNGGNMAFLRAVFDRIGAFDPTLGRKQRDLYGGEEPEFFRRFLASGHVAFYQPNAVVCHAMEKPRLHKNYFRRVHFLEGRTEGLRWTGTHGRTVAGVPLFTFPQLARAASILCLTVWRDGPNRSLRKEMLVWHLLGFMLGCAARRPAAPRTSRQP